MSTGAATMPSLIRLLTIVAILCAVIYGGLYALAHFVQPTPRQMSVYIPPNKFFQAH
jgi:phage shock protein PspC (stress-responsive transcriptional regulator)